jgi:glycosyltransferase involved in cell wall biosynthesis
MNRIMLKELSVFFPAYNEENNIEETIRRALMIVPRVAQKWEILVIDDGSTDKTAKVLSRITKNYVSVNVITHATNKGYGEALKTGLYNSKYEWIVFTDGDGQFDFSEISKMIENIDQASLVVGYRINRQDPVARKILGWGWTFLTNFLLRIQVRDVDCGFKLIKKEVVDKIPRLESSRGGMISPELLAKTRRAGYKISEVGVHHYSRRNGLQTGANLKVIINSFFDLGKLWRSLK